MAQTASNNFITSFDTMVKQAYQGSQLLKGTVREKMNVKGSTHKFYVMDEGLATKKQRLSDVVTMADTQGNVTAVLEDFNVAQYSDIMDIDKLPYDEKQELSKKIAKAIGRKKDKLVLDAINSASTDSVAIDLGGASEGLTVQKILRAKRILDQKNVDSEDRYFVCSAASLEDALNNEKVGSKDYNPLESLFNGKLTEYAGFKFIIMGFRKEGGLPLSGTTRTNFVYHKESVGLAMGTDKAIAIDYVPEKTSWLLNQMFSAGAVVIDTDGIVKVLTEEATI